MTIRGRLRVLAERNVPGLIAAYRSAVRATGALTGSPRRTFTRIYQENAWGSAESRSGPGSNLLATEPIRRALPALLAELRVAALLDVPCGDFNWMKELPLPDIHYLGGDVVPDLIADNTRRYGTALRTFTVLDLTTGPLPRADLVLVRDCFIHLSCRHIRAALRCIRASGSTHLLTTTNPRVRENHDIVTGSYRPINLEAPPFGFPRPLWSVREGPASDPVSGGPLRERGDCLGLWRIADIPQER